MKKEISKEVILKNGFVIPIDYYTEVSYFTSLILEDFRKNEVSRLKDIDIEVQDIMDTLNYKTNFDLMVKYMCCSVVQGFPMITYILESPDEPINDLEDQYGVLAYVYNIEAPQFSESGYTFYKKQNDYYRRIG